MATQTETKTNSSTATATEPSILDGSLANIANEPLAHFVIEGFRTAKKTGIAFWELRQRFSDLKKKETILGYGHNQWEKLCKEQLGLSASKARRMVVDVCETYGLPHPGKKHDGSKNRNYNPPPWFAFVADGTKVDLARSAAQKSVRDGDEVAATYWFRQLYFAEYDVWRLLATIAAEDIGVGDLTVKTHVIELMQLAEKCKDERNSDLLHVMNAAIICCRAEKKRVADDYCIWYRENPTFKMPLPDEVKAEMENTVQPPILDKYKDVHTSEGRKMGRRGKAGEKHFKEVDSKVANESTVPGFAAPIVMACPHCNGTGRVKLPLCEETA